MMQTNSPPPLRDHDALFLDIDGTLIDIAPHPLDVEVPPGLIGRLTSLRSFLGGALALVSGRSLTQIDLLLGETPFDLAGCHGFEWRAASGGDQTLGASSPHLDGAAEYLTAKAREYRALYVERKTHSIALHYRSDPRLHDLAWDLAKETLKMLGSTYRLQGGKSVVEVTPVAAQKGRAIDRFMVMPPYLGRLPVFAGDDLTDESGFDAVNRRGGATIYVGENNADTQARFHLPSPEALRTWIGYVRPNKLAEQPSL